MLNELVVTRNACQIRGMPQVGFAVSTEGAGMWGVTFPDPRAYLSLSGPPGGPLWVRVMPLPPGGSPFERLEFLARNEYAGAPWHPLVFDVPGLLEVDGRQRETIFFFAGQQEARTAVAVIACHVACDGVDLAIIAGMGGEPSWVTDYLAVAAHPGICRVLESFQIGDFEDPNASAGLPRVEQELEEPESEAAEVAEATSAALAGPSARDALKILAELKQAMEAAKLWQSAMPDAAAYTSMSPAQQMAFSLQSSLPSIEQMLKTVVGKGAEVELGAVNGVLEMLGAFPEMLRPFPEATNVVEVLDRAAAQAVS